MNDHDSGDRLMGQWTDEKIQDLIGLKRFSFVVMGCSRCCVLACVDSLFCSITLGN